ncbi:MAG: riboflavin synthase [Prolixibacteraceae bacterium]|nr:riboflavin synthase [Prolixibacteraceae bacterium]
MFSGIIEEFGTVRAIDKEKENVHFTLTCSFADELKVDQSLSHNGVCLTVVEVDKKAKTYKVTAIKETLIKSNLGLLEVGSKVNLERSIVMNGRLDGHIVQGHVDQTAVCTDVEEADGSWYYTFEYSFDPEKARQGYITVEKGSVSVNGVSLTVVNSKDNSFQVAIIPYTYDMTNFHTFRKGTVVNLEFDIIGKYLSKLNTYSGR